MIEDEGGISREVLADQVKDRLLQDILAGRYPPDTRIIETKVAREFGTSQSPVREALRGLEALGVVEITPFRGSRVRRPTSAELLEAYAIRAELEALAARLAIPRMTDADLERFAERAEKMQRCAAAGDPHGVASADAAFHGLLVRMACNETLVRVWHSLEPYSRTYITLVAPNGDPSWTAGLHLPILEALRLRDPAAVECALRKHFDDAGARLGRAGEPGTRWGAGEPAIVR